jgi:hypothetical protein
VQQLAFIASGHHTLYDRAYPRAGKNRSPSRRGVSGFLIEGTDCIDKKLYECIRNNLRGFWRRGLEYWSFILFSFLMLVGIFLVLMGIGAVFAANSAVHSFLVVHYAEREAVAQRAFVLFRDMDAGVAAPRLRRGVQRDAIIISRGDRSGSNGDPS